MFKSKNETINAANYKWMTMTTVPPHNIVTMIQNTIVFFLITLQHKLIKGGGSHLSPDFLIHKILHISLSIAI